jgi:hypothetical protein
MHEDSAEGVPPGMRRAGENPPQDLPVIGWRGGTTEDVPEDSQPGHFPAQVCAPGALAYPADRRCSQCIPDDMSRDLSWQTGNCPHGMQRALRTLHQRTREDGICGLYFAEHGLVRFGAMNNAEALAAKIKESAEAVPLDCS